MESNHQPTDQETFSSRQHEATIAQHNSISRNDLHQIRGRDRSAPAGTAGHLKELKTGPLVPFLKAPLLEDSRQANRGGGIKTGSSGMVWLDSLAARDADRVKI